MIVAIHQPNFIPWLGFFYKWSLADVYVLLDDVQFSKNSFINRNRIKTPQGKQWLTIPVVQKKRFGQKICETKIIENDRWKRKILGSIKANYSKARFFNEYYDELEEVFFEAGNMLVELNIMLLDWIESELMINTPKIYSSKIEKSSGTSTERLVSICKQLGADEYLSGFGGSKYQDEKLFNASGIHLKSYNFKHPVYPQLWGDFIPNLSILDLLFNCGPKSADYIKSVS